MARDYFDLAVALARRGNKFGSVRTEAEGIVFASKREANRYRELRLLERARIITDLRLQPVYPLIVDGVTLGTYRADFAYVEDGHLIVEDVKGVRTPMFRWKAKHMLAQYGITVRET